MAAALVMMACGNDPRRLAWELRFEDASLLSVDGTLEANIVEGGCGAGATKYTARMSSSMPFAGTLTLPPVLPPGRYGLSARMWDLNCVAVAVGCTEVALPQDSGAVTVTLRRDGSGAIEPGCMPCSGSQCADIDASVDASTPRDTGVAPGDASTACTRFGPFGAPVGMTAVNSSASEFDPSVSQDGLTLLFSSDRTTGKGDFDIWVATRSSKAAAFGAPVNLSQINTAGYECEPELTVDGLTLFFVQGPSTNHDLAFATRSAVGQPFGAVTLLTATNSASNDEGVTVSSDGLTLYLASDRGGGAGKLDLRVAQRSSTAAAFGAATLIAGVNSSADDAWAAISRDGLALYFTSGRATGAGLLDIWVTTRASVSSAFTTPTAVTELNTTSDEGDPFLSADGTTLYFSSNRPGGAGGSDLYVATRPCLP